MKRKMIVKLLFLSMLLTVLPGQMAVRADVPTPLAFSASPTNFVIGSFSTVMICMAQQTNSPTQDFNTGDISGIVLDGSAGSVYAVDPVLIVNSANLIPTDFAVTRGIGNRNKVIITYQTQSPKSFLFGESICVNVVFSTSETPGAAIIRFYNKFTGQTGVLPSVTIQIIDPVAITQQRGALASINTLPGVQPAFIRVDKSSGQDSGMPLMIQGGAAGPDFLDGGDLILAGGQSNGTAGGGHARVQTEFGARLIDRDIVVAKPKAMPLTSPATVNLVDFQSPFSLNGGTSAGGRLYYTIRATDGNNQEISESGVIPFLVSGSAVSCLPPVDVIHLGTGSSSVNAGCAVGVSNLGRPALGISDNVMFEIPASIVVHNVSYRVAQKGGTFITVLP
jgi:hypothetical protein